MKRKTLLLYHEDPHTLLTHRRSRKERRMTSILILDLALTGALLLLIGGSVVFYLSNYRWLKAYGTDVGAIITHVRRDNIAHQNGLVTATWPVRPKVRRWTFKS